MDQGQQAKPIFGEGDSMTKRSKGQPKPGGKKDMRFNRNKKTVKKPRLNPIQARVGSK